MDLTVVKLLLHVNQNAYLIRNITSYIVVGIDEDDIINMNNITYTSGTQPFGHGSQMCFDLSVIDDELVEAIEQYTICATGQALQVVFEGGNCIDIFIEDNDGMSKCNNIFVQD